MVSAASSIVLFVAALFSLSAPALAGLSIGGATVAQNLFGKGYVPSFNNLGKGTVSFVATSSQGMTFASASIVNLRIPFDPHRFFYRDV